MTTSGGHDNDSSNEKQLICLLNNTLTKFAYAMSLTLFCGTLFTALIIKTLLFSPISVFFFDFLNWHFLRLLKSALLFNYIIRFFSITRIVFFFIKILTKQFFFFFYLQNDTFTDFICFDCFIACWWAQNAYDLPRIVVLQLALVRTSIQTHNLHDEMLRARCELHAVHTCTFCT